MKRTLQTLTGLALLAYGFYSGNAWFYLGVIPLLVGLTGWCPMMKLKGLCPGNSCTSATSPQKDAGSTCCSSEEPSACCAPDPTLVPPANTHSKSKPDRTQNGKTTTIIKILGTGCANCIALENAVREAVTDFPGSFEIIKVQDPADIMQYKVMRTPGLVMNEEVKSSGRKLSVLEVQNFLKEIHA